MTTRYHLELALIVSDYVSLENLEAHLDCVADSFAELQGRPGSRHGANLSKGIVTFTLSVDAQAPPEALQIAQGVVRSAIHAADGCPGRLGKKLRPWM
jgi:hypothetical protein